MINDGIDAVCFYQSSVVLIVIGLCAVNNNRVDNVGYVKEIGVMLMRSTQEVTVSLCQVRFASGHTQPRRLLVAAIKLASTVILGRMFRMIVTYK